MLFLGHHFSTRQEIQFFFPCFQFGMRINPPVFATVGFAHSFREQVECRVVFALELSEELVQGQG